MLPDKVRGLNFLIVDDFESIRRMLTETLKKNGIDKIQQATSANDAIKKITSQLNQPGKFNFVISDFNMPDGNGLDLIKFIRSQSELKRLPFLLLTSQSEIEVVLECIKAGASDYVIKPWKEEELIKKLISLTG